jgi:hypothetical protein
MKLRKIVVIDEEMEMGLQKRGKVIRFRINPNHANPDSQYHKEKRQQILQI